MHLKRNNGIDLFRLIGAFFIIILHTSYGNLDIEIIEHLRLSARWAVPFYFMATGFFLGKKIENGNLEFRKIQSNLITLLSIFIVSSVIYMPINATRSKFLYDIENLLTGTFFHLWFIGSLIVGYIIIWFIYQIRRSNLLPYISAGLIMLALVCDSYDQFLGTNIDYSLFRYLLSIPFIYIGIVLSKRTFSSRRSYIWILLAAGGFVLQLVEVNILYDLFDYSKLDHQFLVGTILTVIPLFIYSTLIDIKESALTKWGKQQSLFIYLYHPLILLLTSMSIKKLFPNSYESIQAFSPISGFILTLLLAILLKKYIPIIYNLLNGKISAKTIPSK